MQADSRPNVRRRVGLFTVWGMGVVLAFTSVSQTVASGTFGADARAYWLAGRAAHPYSSPPRTLDAFLYSPAFAQMTRPFASLSWPAFLTVWVILEAAVFYWLLRPLGGAWVLPLLLCCAPELVMGNVNAFLALAVVVGMRRPAAWVFPALTKVTPGIGLLWFAARREWRACFVALLSVLALTAISFLLAPSLWREWVTFLVESRGAGGRSVLVRAATAAVVIWFAGARDRRWVIAPALLLATPVVSGLSATLLTAVPRLTGGSTSPSQGAPVLSQEDGSL